jgi:hypothetical protein
MDCVSSQAGLPLSRLLVYCLSLLIYQADYLLLNMEFDLQSLFRLHVHSCSHWLFPRNPNLLPPAFGLIYEGAIGQPR